MTLSEYIDTLGDSVAASLFKVKPRTVASWRRGERRPSIPQAKIILTKTHGKVDFFGIYGK